MKLIATRKEDQNRAAVDPWTLVHFSAGLALGLLGAPIRPFAAAAVGYEIAEQFTERRPLGHRIFNMSGPESLPNVLVDIAVFAVGFRAGLRWRAGR